MEGSERTLKTSGDGSDGPIDAADELFGFCAGCCGMRSVHIPENRSQEVWHVALLQTASRRDHGARQVTIDRPSHKVLHARRQTERNWSIGVQFVCNFSISKLIATALSFVLFLSLISKTNESLKSCPVARFTFISSIFSQLRCNTNSATLSNAKCRDI